MCARCFPTTTEVVVTSSLTKPRTLISAGLELHRARVPNRVPVDRLAGAVREAVNLATMRVCKWRDPDSNRGHHDFQTDAPNTRTAAAPPANAPVPGPVQGGRNAWRSLPEEACVAVARRPTFAARGMKLRC